MTRPTLFSFLLLVGLASTSRAGAVYYDGTFTSDDQQQLTTFSVSTSEVVTMRTEGYAGAPELSKPGGGFDPILSLFDGTGTLIALNGDGGCGLVNKDSVTGNCWGSYLSQKLAPGSYTLALTEQDNYPNGPTLNDGFGQTGQGDFTAAEVGQLNGAFWDASGDQRNGNWIRPHRRVGYSPRRTGAGQLQGCSGMPLPRPVHRQATASVIRLANKIAPRKRDLVALSPEVSLLL